MAIYIIFHITLSRRDSYINHWKVAIRGLVSQETTIVSAQIDILMIIISNLRDGGES
jgi:hypothetical protein